MKKLSMLVAVLAMAFISQAVLIDGGFDGALSSGKVSSAALDQGWQGKSQWRIVGGAAVRQNVNPLVDRPFGQTFTDARDGSFTFSFDYNNADATVMMVAMIGVSFNATNPNFPGTLDSIGTGSALAIPAGTKQSFTDLLGSEVTTFSSAIGSGSFSQVITLNSTSFDAYMVAFTSAGTGSAIDNVMITSTVAPLGGYDGWISAYWSDADAELGSDPDFDTMDNLLEYALGGNPTVDDSSSVLPVNFVDADAVIYVYNRRIDWQDVGLLYELQLSENLVATAFSNDAAAYVESVSSQPNGDYEAVTNSISTITRTTQFITLSVEQQ